MNRSIMTCFSFRSFYFLLGTGLLCCLNSCIFHRLDVQTQYLSHENLASSYIGTPDPHLDDPVIGQRLLIQWCLSSHEITDDVYLRLKVRFRNHKEKEIRSVINKKRGYFIYDLTNQEYSETGGVLTYLAEIRTDLCVIECWKHPLWTELISFDFSENESEPTE